MLCSGCHLRRPTPLAPFGTFFFPSHTCTHYYYYTTTTLLSRLVPIQLQRSAEQSRAEQKSSRLNRAAPLVTGKRRERVRKKQGALPEPSSCCLLAAKAATALTNNYSSRFGFCSPLLLAIERTW